MKNRHPYTLILAGALLLPLASVVHAAEVKPSRLVAANEIHEQIRELNSRLDIGKRHFDPFGQVQELNRPLPTQEGGDVPEPKPTSMDKIVATIPVVAVAPKQGRIMVGARPWKIGEVKKVPYRGHKFDIKLTRVAAADMDFRNEKTGDTATLKFKGAIEDPKLPDPW